MAALARDRGRCGRGFDRWYGFHGGETHQFVPALYHDNHSVRPARDLRGRLPPERGPGRPGHRVPGRPARRRRPAPVLPVLRHRGLPLAPPGAGRLDRALPGSLRRRLGRVARAHLRPAAGHGPACPRARSCRPGRPGCRPGTTWTPPTSARGRPVHGVLRRLPVPHRRPDRPGARLHRRARRARRHPGDAWCRTTAPAPRAGPRGRSTTPG